MERKTQIQVVRDYLVSGHTLTSNEAREKWGVTRLADLIFKLRRAGYIIQNTQRATITKLGGKAWYVEYKLIGFEKGAELNDI